METLTGDTLQEYVHDLRRTLGQLPFGEIEQFVELLHEARLADRQVFIMGNGGSASTASHFVCDLSKNTRREGWPQFRVLGLADNMASLSAYANDEGYAQVFAGQLAAFIRPDDVVIAISTSGNSPNVLRAVELAAARQARTVAFTGFDGGQLGRMVELHIHVASDCIEQVEDVHLALEHMVCTALRRKLAGVKGNTEGRWS